MLDFKKFQDLLDSWLRKSFEKCEKSDPNFEPTVDDAVNEELILNVCSNVNIRNERVFMVYESKLDELLKNCLNRSAIIVEKNIMKGGGTQVHYKLSCLNGCQTSWSTQPILSAAAGTLFYTWLPIITFVNI